MKYYSYRIKILEAGPILLYFPSFFAVVLTLQWVHGDGPALGCPGKRRIRIRNTGNPGVCLEGVTDVEYIFLDGTRAEPPLFTLSSQPE